MQGFSGAYPTDLNGVARLSSVDMAANQGPHSFLRRSFAPQTQVIARQAETPDGHLSVCFPLGPVADGFQANAAPDCGFANMMSGCSCVCHSLFQNEVIGG
jgi:hypothetical protein